MRRNLIHGFLSIWFAIASYSLSSQELPIRQFTTQDGLPSNMVYHVGQDSRGVLWIATDGGLVRYDGIAFRTYTTAQGLPTNDIYSAMVDRYDRVWLCAKGNRLTYIERDSVKEVSPKEIPQVDRLASIYSTDVRSYDGKVNLVFRYKNTEEIPVLCGLDSIEILKIPTEQSGQGLAAYWNYKYLGDLDSSTRVFLSANPFRSKSFYLVAGRDDTTIIEITELVRPRMGKSYNCFSIPNSKNQFQLILAMGEELVMLTPDSLPPWFIPPKGSSADSADIIQVFKAYSTGYWALNKNSQLYLINEGRNAIHEVKGLDEFSMNTISPGRDGSLWIATNNQGLIQLVSDWQGVKCYSQISGVKSGFISCMAKAPNGLVYLGNTNDHFDVLEGNSIFQQPKLRMYQHENNNQAYKDYMLLFDEAGGLYRTWHFSYLSPSQLDAKGNYDAFEPARYTTHDISKNNTKLFLPDNKNAISNFGMKDATWLNDTTIIGAIDELGIAFLKLTDPGYQINHPFPNRLTTRTLCLKNDTIWCGENNKIVSVVDDSLIDHPFPHNVSRIRNGRGSTLWVGTEGFGLWHVDTRTDSSYRIDIGKGNTIRDIAPAPDGSVWVADERLVHHIQGNPGNWQLRSYPLANPLHRPVSLLVDSLVYIGSQQALYVMDPRKLSPSRPRPTLVLNRFEGNGDTLAQGSFDLSGEAYAFPHNARNFTVHYSGISHWAQEHVRYRYRLRGDSDAWTETPKTDLSFFLLLPGTYTLEIQAIDLWRQESEVLSIPLIIRSPWWQTGWFYGALVLVLLLVGWALFRWYRRREKARRVLTELRLQALQAQMNPHFVFNAMSAIQAFILKEDKMAANTYLGHFADLIRAYLQASSQRSVRVEQEVDMLDKYLSLQSLRMPYPLQYAITLAPEVDAFAEIPALILQPFVENAIQHGLLNKEGPGNIAVSFRQEKQQIKVVIEDNGIGREGSRALKAEGKEQHVSMGMQLVKNRREMIGLIQKRDVHVKVTDLYNDEKPAGTRVEVYFELPE